MSLFDWECFQSFINSGLYNVVEADELHTPSYELSLKRDENLQIHLTSKSRSPKRYDKKRHELGTVRESHEKATLKSKVSESCVFLDGVVVNATNEINNTSEQKYIEDHASIHSVKGELKQPESGKYLFEWLGNLDDGFYLWPDMLHLEKSEHVKINFGDKKYEELSFQDTNRTELSSCRSVARLVIKNTELFLITKSQDGNKRGCILYTSLLPEDERRKIRDCLSFSLGRPLIYLGNTVLDSDYSLVSFYAESAYSFDGKANELVSTPPFELGGKYKRELSDTTLEYVTDKLYDVYDEYNLRSIFWQYWHAVCSPAHMAPVLFGASIEALSEAIKSKNSEKIQSRLIPKDKWRELNKQFVKMLDDSTIDLEAKRIMKKKLGLLNQAPQRVLTERFYDFLGLEFTIAESDVWNRRNQSAHGEFISHDDYIGLIRDVKILKVLLHRLIIKVSECSNNYIDYYSLGHPTRRLETGIPPEAHSSS